MWPRGWRRGGALGLAACAAILAAGGVAGELPGGSGAAAEASATAPASAARSAPRVRQLVVFRSGWALGRRVRAARSIARVGRRRCAVGAGTALAALLRSRPGRIGLRDYGSCSRRAGDAGGLYVRSIRRDRGRGQNGWVYKVGRTLATAGAGDPSGPFGRGRLRGGRRVTWFYCRYRRGCQRTLALRARPAGARLVTVRVRGYDDAGRGVAVAGARVRAGGSSTLTDSGGRALLRLRPGRHTVSAAKRGLVRSFGERVRIRR